LGNTRREGRKLARNNDHARKEIPEERGYALASMLNIEKEGRRTWSLRRPKKSNKVKESDGKSKIPLTVSQIIHKNVKINLTPKGNSGKARSLVMPFLEARKGEREGQDNIWGRLTHPGRVSVFWG